MVAVCQERPWTPAVHTDRNVKRGARQKPEKPPGQNRKRDGRGGDRKSALYLLQCRMGLIPLAEACKK